MQLTSFPDFPIIEIYTNTKVKEKIGFADQEFHFCNNCGHGQISNIIPPEILYGAGAIFVLAWNASVIAAAVGIFSKSRLINLPIGIVRYMIHGLPEIAAYFITALAGGIVSVAIIKHDTRSRKFWNILQDSLNLIIVAVLILFFAELIEVFIIPALF